VEGVDVEGVDVEGVDVEGDDGVSATGACVGDKVPVSEVFEL
jgi:hypothetical protein